MQTSIRRLRRIFNTAIVVLCVFAAFKFISDPQVAAVWSYLQSPQHSPVEWLLIAIFVLVVLDRLERMAASWETRE